MEYLKRRKMGKKNKRRKGEKLKIKRK